MTEGRKKYLRFAYPILGGFWLCFTWTFAESSGPETMWTGLLAGLAFLAASLQLEWKTRRERRLGTLREEAGEDDSAVHWSSGDENRKSRVSRAVARSVRSHPNGPGRGLFPSVLAVVRLRALAGWRKALTEKAKLALGVVFTGVFAVNYMFSLRRMEDAPFEHSPVDLLFVVMCLFVLVTVLQVAPLTQWFSRREGAQFGLSVRQRSAMAVGTGLIGLPMVLVLLNETLALVFAGSLGWPRGVEWVFEGIDVGSAVCALVAAGPLGAVVMGGRGRGRWFGSWLAILLLGVLGASAVAPLWAAGGPWASAAVSVGRLVLILLLLAGAFVLEQQSPNDRGAKATKRRGRAAPKEPTGDRPAAVAVRAPAGVWSRPIFVVALAQARMMLRFRQVRLNLVVSWAMPLVMAFLFRGEESASGAGQFALWMAASIAAFLGVFWVAFFANLLGFAASGARRLAMSAETARFACLPGKVLGVVSVVGVSVIAQTMVLTMLLADQMQPAERTLPFLVAAFSLVGLAGAGTVVSVTFPRKPELHEQRDFFCSVLGLVVLGAAWLLQMAVAGGVLAAARSLGGSTAAVTAMTVLLLLAAAGCGFLVAALAKGDWLRRRLREWAVTV